MENPSSLWKALPGGVLLLSGHEIEIDLLDNGDYRCTLPGGRVIAVAMPGMLAPLLELAERIALERACFKVLE